MNNNFYYNDNNKQANSSSQKNLLLIFAAIVLIAIGYIMMTSGMFDKVSKVETTIDNKIVYQGKDELVKVKIKTNSEFNPVVKFRSKNGKFTVSEDRQEGKEVETKIVAKESGEDILIVEVGRDEGKKDKVEEVKVLICEELKLLNTTDKTLSMKEGNNIQLKFNVDDKCLGGYEIYVENDKIADIDNSYVLNAKKSGKTTLVLKGSKTIKYALTIKPTKVNVTGVRINTKDFNLAIGKTKNLSVTVKPSDATNKKVKYESSDSEVATVTTGGKVKGIKIGVATITVTSEDNTSKKDTIKVRVYKPEPPVPTVKVTSIKFDKASESMYVGESRSLTTTISPSNATNKGISCTSNNQKVATAKVSGNACAVKGVGAGSAVITVTTKDGNKKATASVTVSKKPSTTVKVTSIKFDKTSDSVYVGDSKSLTTTISPSNATNKGISCASNNQKVATVTTSNNACVVKGVGAGSAVITVTTKDGSKKATASVTVSKKQAQVVKVTSAKFEKSSYSVSLNQTVVAVVGITPTNATNKTITCKSQNTSIATVTYSGNKCTIKGVKVGTTTIEAYTSDGNKKTTTEVKVLPISVKSISFEKTSYTVDANAQITANVNISPANASSKVISCSSSDNGVATAAAKNTSCIIKGIKAGSVTITATSQDGNKTATTKVNVNSAQVIKEYTIEFNCNGGTGTTASQKVKTGEKFTLNANACSKTYYTFASWTDPSGAKWNNKYSGIWNYTNGQYGITNNKLVLKAKWTGALKATSNAKKPTGIYAGKCEELDRHRKDSNGKGSGFSERNVPYLYSGEYCSYESNTLKYYIFRPNDTYAITYIWAKDPYNQMKIAVAEHDSNYKFKQSKSTEIINHEIITKGYSNKGLVGINGSAMISGSYYKNAKRPDWLGQPAVTLFINDGKVIRYPDYDYWVTSQEHKGLTKDGYLTHYNLYSNNKEKTDATVNQVIKDGVKYTFGFRPILVYQKASRYSGAKDWNSPNIREAIGQIDLNNFVYITNTLASDDAGRAKGLTFKQIADLMVSLGVYNGYNLDGGGSTSYFYKGKTNKLFGPGRAYDSRTSGDIIYFVEK